MKKLSLKNNASFVIAEVGNNHEGSFDVALKLVEEAAKCGVDAIKFQTFKTELYTAPLDEARYKRLKSFELSYEQFDKLRQLAHTLGIFFISTPFDFESLDFLYKTADAIKIASSDNNFIPFLKKACSLDKPLIVSGGMLDQAGILNLIQNIKQWRKPEWIDETAVLHCVSAYPVSPEELNLSFLSSLKSKAAPLGFGYSDHSESSLSLLVAASFGANVIEKHFTLDKNFSSFRDHQLSADPKEMKDAVQKIREIQKMLGDGSKKISPLELPVIQAARRSAFTSKDLSKGSTLKEEDILWLRPSGEITPENYEKYIGTSLKKNFAKIEKIQPSDLQ